MASKPTARQATVKHAHPTETWTLTLNRYQRDNLLWLLNVCGYPSGQSAAVEPFHLAHTGDWTGEIANMLYKDEWGGDVEEPHVTNVIDHNDHPNKPVERLREEIETWVLERKRGS